MTNPDFFPEALQRQQELNELQRLKAENARLEREANWLAGYLTIGAHESYDAARRRWRDAARKAVEEA